MGEHIREAQKKTLIIARVRISRNETLECKVSAHIKKRTRENEYFMYLEAKTLVGCTYKGIAYKTLTMVHARISRNETLSTYEGVWNKNPSSWELCMLSSQTLAS